MEGLKRTATRQTNKKGWHNSQTTQQNLLTLICMFQRNTNMPGWSFLDLKYCINTVCSPLKYFLLWNLHISLFSIENTNLKLLSATFLSFKAYIQVFFDTTLECFLKNIFDNIFQNYKSRLEQGLLGQWSMIGVTILPWDINIALHMFFTKNVKSNYVHFHCCVNVQMFAQTI